MNDLYGICPFVTSQKVLSGKWSIVILHQLSEGTKRFNELHREIGDLTQATLTKQLRFLEDEGMIVRHVFPEVPPHVEYSLSPIGEKFTSVLTALESWGTEYIGYLKQKDEYDTLIANKAIEEYKTKPITKSHEDAWEEIYKS